jgi:hypothetical protein
VVHTLRAVLARSFNSTGSISHRLAPDAAIPTGGDRGWGRFHAAFSYVVSSGAIVTRTTSRLTGSGIAGSSNSLVNLANFNEKGVWEHPQSEY